MHTSRRINVYLRESQIQFLIKLGVSTSESIRRAIDDYIEKIKGQTATTSPSVKGGE